jgi:hypothetical protein
MTKKTFDIDFSNQYDLIIENIEKQNGIKDFPLRTFCYNNLVDSYTKQSILTERQANNFIIPKKYLKK